MLEMTAKALMWAVLGWYAVSLLIGGVLLARDEWRHRRAKPRPEDVREYADRLEAAHGADAFRQIGEAMYDARLSQDFQRHRFLKAVSGELVGRLMAKSKSR